MTPKEKRRHLERVYDQFYEPIGRAPITDCYYCGKTASQYDHVPPLSTLPEIPDQPLRLVPACHHCNLTLHTYRKTSILQRIEYLAGQAPPQNQPRIDRLRNQWRAVRNAAQHQLHHFTQAIQHRLDAHQREADQLLAEIHADISLINQSLNPLHAATDDELRQWENDRGEPITPHQPACAASATRSQARPPPKSDPSQS